MTSSVFISKIKLHNYKSIKNCDVRLGPLQFLLGRNGAGKSNFLDAFRLISDSLNQSLEHALRDRGGIAEVRRRSTEHGHPTHVSIEIDWCLPTCATGSYGFTLGAASGGGFSVLKETCVVRDSSDPLNLREHVYEVADGALQKKSFDVGPAAHNNRLYLVAASGMPEFRPLYDALSRMGFYNLNPDVMRTRQQPDKGDILMRDGGNIASVLDVLKREHADEFRQIIEMLSKVVPGISEVNVKHVLNFETLEFHQRVRSAANKEFLRFMALNMSDGTLRTLGVLTALVQARAAGRHRIPLIGIEEPETAIHPYAAAVMRDCIREAAYSTQVLVTSHSPELLDSPDIEPETVLTVGGYGDVNTVVQPLLPQDADLIREHLCTPGELFRQNQIAQAVDPGIGQTELPLGEGC